MIRVGAAECYPARKLCRALRAGSDGWCRQDLGSSPFKDKRRFTDLATSKLNTDREDASVFDDFHFLSRNETLDRSSQHVAMALRRNKQQGLRLAVHARWIALSITSVLLVMTIQSWDVVYYHLILAGLALIGWLQLQAGRSGRSRRELALVFCDILLMVFGMLYPNPFLEVDWPTATQYALENFKYFYVFLAAMTLGYSWRTVFAYGTWTTGLWLVGMLLVLWLGSTDEDLTLRIKEAVRGDERLLELIDPSNTRIAARIEELAVFLIVAGILSINSFRTNQLLIQQAEAARERANLARHFPPNLVEQLAGSDQPFAEVRAQQVVVMFVDIVGFTSLAETSPPDVVVAMLRKFHRLVEEAVFEHGGTLDKYLGDGVMVTFGTPKAGDGDAANALACVDTLINRMKDWNLERNNRAESTIKASIGLHYGPVILGDIGTERRLEYAVLGDTVNVASRLEEMTRIFECQCLVSDAVIEAAGGSGATQKLQLHQYERIPETQQLRGRDAQIVVWQR